MESRRATEFPGLASDWLQEALLLAEGETPFPWQQKLLDQFIEGTIARSLDIPTGLGKTAVMAIWLVARACGAPLPRRLVYVVDRRAVVDQASDVARKLRDFAERKPEIKPALGLEMRSLPISTLRGQHVDNKEWLESPASTAIVVGTVDMIGSRLLFEGYATSRKMRPYHAGLLGSDTLVVLDEAHLVPPFEKLIETVAADDAAFGPKDELRKIVPPFRLLSLSATGRTNQGKVVGLEEADLEHPVVARRLVAPKRLTVPPIDDGAKLSEELAEKAWELTKRPMRMVRCIVFCDKRSDATATKTAVEKRASGDPKAGIAPVQVDTELFVGGRRVFEREGAAKRLAKLGFIAGTKVERTRPAFLFATSAGEVGVDLDADHMVSDLVAWERMVQRLGRVNRRGDGQAKVIVVVPPQPEPKRALRDALGKEPTDRTEKEAKAVADYEKARAQVAAVREVFDNLPKKSGSRDASPGAIRALQLRARSNAGLRTIVDAATTPAPLRPALSRALVDAWSMTSLKEHTGRPEITPWLRGWIPDDPPQTAVVWRKYLPVRRTRGHSATRNEIESFFEAAPPHTSEILETETYRVVDWLGARATGLESSVPDPSRIEDEDGDHVGQPPALRKSEVAGIVLTPAGDLFKILKLESLALKNGKREGDWKKELNRILAGRTLVVDARIRGLTDGLLDSDAEGTPRTADDDAVWIPTDSVNTDGTSSSQAPVVRFRVQSAEAGAPRAVDKQWREGFRFASELSDEGEPTRWLIVDKWRADAASEDDRAVAIRPQLLGEHQAWAEDRARQLATNLNLPDVYVDMLGIAARLHDEGKQAGRWQRAFNARRDGLYAKTRGPVNFALLDGYRHEFGSLPFAAKDERLGRLPEDLRDLALHLIAAHHGFARPIIGTNGCEDAPPSALQERAREIALRFARMQKRWGPWGLAWWEALLRAADQQASRDNDAIESIAVKESG